MTEETKDLAAEALRMLPYGFYAVTTNDGAGEVNIMVANWFSQASFTPRLVILALAKNSYSHTLLEKGKVFALNIFRKEDDRLIKAFTKSRARKPDKLDGAAYTLSPIVQCPVLDGVAAYLEIRVREIHDIGGDHDLVVGEVVGAEVLKPGECTDTLNLPHLGWSYAG